jgi:Ohr subfamily peroxiredoxin
MKILYTAEATATGGRTGHTRTSDGSIDIDLVPPPELGGPGTPGTNPEQLFAAGYAGCFDNAVVLSARRMKLDATGAQVTARVGLGATGDGGFGLAVELVVDLPNVEPDAARALIAAAHKVCPYSNATRGNVDVELTLASDKAASAAN